MGTCPTCGAPGGAGDDFCGNCGAYLGWSEAAPAPDAPAAPPPDLPPAPSSPPAGGPVPSPHEQPADRGGAAAADAPRAAAPRFGDAAPYPGGAPPAAPPMPMEAPGPAASGTGARPPQVPAAPPPVAPGAPAPPSVPDQRPPAGPVDAPAPDAVRPVRPAKAVAPRPVVRPVAAPGDAAGVPCPACGTPNLPGRRFCRRCAAELNPAARPAPLPWWRTVWPLRRRVRAGSGRVVRFLVILAVVVALGAGGVLLLPAARNVFEDTEDKLHEPEAVTPVSTEASAEVPGHPARNTTDGLSNRYWGAPEPGAWVTYTFRTPFRLVDLVVFNGASTSPEEYAREARALEIDLEVTTAGGETHHKKLTLGDRAGKQTISTAFSDVKTVRLVLHAPTGLTPGRHLALAEVEFFRRS